MVYPELDKKDDQYERVHEDSQNTVNKTDREMRSIKRQFKKNEEASKEAPPLKLSKEDDNQRSESTEAPPLDSPMQEVNQMQNKGVEGGAVNTEQGRDQTPGAKTEIGVDKQAIGFGAEGERGFSTWLNFFPYDGNAFYGYEMDRLQYLDWQKLLNHNNEVVQLPETSKQLNFQTNIRCFVMSRLGKGTFSEVHEILNYCYEPFAAKVIHHRQDKAFAAELETFRRIRGSPHPNLLRLISHETLVDGREVFITRVMGQSLGKTLRENKKCVSFPMKSVKNIGLQIVNAMRHLELLGVYHLDLKPDNILLVKGDYHIANETSDYPEIVLGKEDIVVGDFGVARFDISQYKPKDELQTLPYRAPEIFLGTGFTHTTDVWSFAATLGMLYSGRTMFFFRREEIATPDYYTVENEEHQDQFEHIMELVGNPISDQLYSRIPKDGSTISVERVMNKFRKEHPLEWNHGQDTSSDDYKSLYDLLTKSFRIDDRERLTFAEVQDHKFFKI